MPAKSFTEEQVVQIVREAETGTTALSKLCRSHGVSETTVYKWRKKYSGVDVTAVTRLRELEQENTRLKRLLAERDLEVEVGCLLGERGAQPKEPCLLGTTAHKMPNCTSTTATRRGRSHWCRELAKKMTWSVCRHRRLSLPAREARSRISG